MDWWATASHIMAQSIKNCPVLPSYVHANIGETSCVLAARPDLVKMTKAVDEKDYKTFFEYRMDQYTRSGMEVETQPRVQLNLENKSLVWL